MMQTDYYFTLSPDEFLSYVAKNLAPRMVTEGYIPWVVTMSASGYMSIRLPSLVTYFTLQNDFTATANGRCNEMASRLLTETVDIFLKAGLVIFHPETRHLYANLCIDGRVYNYDASDETDLILTALRYNGTIDS